MKEDIRVWEFYLKTNEATLRMPKMDWNGIDGDLSVSNIRDLAKNRWSGSLYKYKLHSDVSSTELNSCSSVVYETSL